MFALISIGWFVLFVISIIAVFEVIGFSGLTRMFPEGKRAWHLPVQIAALTFFAIMLMYNPFITWSYR